ncbi:MAG: enoyl-CoA hydratase/isomerase family protein [Gammaproteobacteria bacterium]|jgi:enoyl-CoA hydratase/carnithine racemase
MNVITAQHDGWIEIILNRPERRNAITGPLGEELCAAIEGASADDGVRVILLRGNDHAFCSGLDLKEFNADPAPDWFPEFGKIWRSVHKALFQCPKTIVGALERYAINGGAALALSCDLLVAGDSAFLQVGEVRQGMAAPYNLAWLRLRHSETTTMQIALTGRRFLGKELAALGVAYASVHDDEVTERAQTLAEELASYPPGALARIKAVARRYTTESNADEWFDRATPREGGPRPRPKRVK